MRDSRIEVTRYWGKGGLRRYFPKGAVSVWGDGIVLGASEWGWVMAAQHCECAQCHRTIS